MILPRPVSAALAAALLMLPGGCGAEAPLPQEPASDEAVPALPELGLMGTIPIYWGEADTLGELVNSEGAQHWARARLEAEYRIRPLDALDDESLAGLDFMLLAQPRPLGAAENVALDAWVRGGGNLLLFADPMLTGESRFALGDRRRPQDVILLSPILAHWGLELQFDMDQAAGLALLEAPGTSIPVSLPGRFAAGESDCALSVRDVLARCKIGSGSVVILADAALLDLYDPHPAAAPALAWLLGQSFANAGNDGTSPRVNEAPKRNQ